MANNLQCPFYLEYCPRGCPRTPGACHRRADELVAPLQQDPVSKEPKRSQILNTAKQLINGDRQNTYGDATEDFTRTGKMWAAVLGLDTVTPEQVALCMTLVKIGRLCESPNHTDSWVDGCGYLALGGEIGTRGHD